MTRASLIVLFGALTCGLAGCAFQSSPLKPQALGLPDSGQGSGTSGTTGATGGTGSIQPGQPTGGTGDKDAGDGPQLSFADAGKDTGTPDAAAKDAGKDTGTPDAGTDSGLPASCAIPSNEGLPCDDGKFCTTGETCSSGKCGGGMPMNCALLNNACNDGVCNEAKDTCERMPAREGATCSDLLFCTMSTACRGGVCAQSYCAPSQSCMLASCPQNCKCDTVCGGAKDCRAGCGDNSVCGIDCTDADSCRYACASNATCTVDCTHAGTCAVTCSAGSACEIDCTDANNCHDVQCQLGAACLLHCDGASNCGFASGTSGCWSGTPLSCDGGIKVCGRMCP